MKSRLHGPSHEMEKLNSQGDAYWLEDVILANGLVIREADVMEIGSGWLRIKDHADDRVSWVNVDHIVSLNIVEG